jgi:hypothetical protein
VVKTRLALDTSYTYRGHEDDKRYLSKSVYARLMQLRLSFRTVGLVADIRAAGRNALLKDPR